MRPPIVTLVVALALTAPAWAQEAARKPAETRMAGPGRTSMVVRMQGPYEADVPLQVVCYFRRTPDSDSRMKGAPVELDGRLGGLIGSLRSRGDFGGDELETILIDAPEGTIKPERLLLVGLGDEDALSLATMERVGRTALREAVKLGATRVAFAPLIRDQGDVRLATGDVERAVTRGVLLAYDTEKRLQAEGFARPFILEEWITEAGPAYFDETVAGVAKAVDEARGAADARPSRPYSAKSR